MKQVFASLRSGKKLAEPAKKPRGAIGPSFAGSIAFRDVRHAYGDVEVLHGINMDVQPRETICLLGESGCGKTTLLRIAAGIERPTSGSMLINGSEVAGPKTFIQPEKRSVGLVFQDYALFPHLNILHNVMFGLGDYPRADAERIARQALTRVRLDDYAEAFPHMLSGGQQQRVALARAIAPRPEILLLDEPFSGLDSVLRDDIREETFSILRETGATTIIVTHDPEEALYLGDRIALMRNGKFEQVGTPQDLYRSPKNDFVAGFFGGLNGFEAVVHGGIVETPLGEFAAPGFPSGVEVSVLVRMEGVDIRNFDAEDGLAHGRIVSERFSGDVAWVSVLVDGDRDPIKLKVKARRAFDSNLVSFVVDPAAVLIFTRT